MEVAKRSNVNNKYNKNNRYRKNSNKPYPNKNKSKLKGDTIHNFTRYANLGTFSVDSVLGAVGAYDFKLSDVPNTADFTNIFDMYKINAVLISFIPVMTENVSLSTVNNPANVRLFTAIDYNNAATPSSVDTIREYQTAKWTSIFKIHTRYVPKPQILDGSSYSVSPWVATSSPSTPWYGIKFAVDPTLSTVSTQTLFRVEAKYYLSFKQVR